MAMIKRAQKEDLDQAAELAALLWDRHAKEELICEFDALLSDQEAALFLCFIEGKAVGFAQCQLRHDYVEGTKTSPVGYLEGIFILEEDRQKGYAKELLLACEDWAKEMHCSEFASDCELENADSLNFHKAMGFQEMNRIICFKKEL